MYHEREREWLSSHPHYISRGVRVFPNGARVLTRQDIVQFALLGRRGLDHMEGRILGVSPAGYANNMYCITQQKGSQDLDALMEFFAGPLLPYDAAAPLQPW